jgi:predicted rRNA methylase YqxC with S4 and FtsJ domains
VVNLEGHNLATLDRALVPDVVGLATMDLSYLAVSDALPQLAGIDLETHADLVALVKPTFELHAVTPARSNEDVSRAIEHAERAMVSLGWHVRGRCDAPATGRRGAREAFVHGRGEPHA